MANLGFETDDPAQPGNPDDWTLSGTWSPITALFTLLIGLTPDETFEEGWTSNEDYEQDLPTLVAQGTFNPGDKLFDDFEEEWSGNEDYEQDIPSGTVVDGTFVLGGTEEQFEFGWSGNGQYESVLPTAVVVDATFDPGAKLSEDYEEEWSGNEGYHTALPTNSVITATFDGLLIGDQVTADPPSDLLTKSTPHGFAVNDIVSLLTTGTLPSPLTVGISFFVHSIVGANQFRLASTLFGAQIDITDTGTGEHFVQFFIENGQLEENFESVKLEQQIVADPATDVMTTSTPPLGLAVDDVVTFRTTAILPQPLVVGFRFLVESTNAVDDFRVKGTLAGAQIDITDVGVGQNFVLFDPVKFWTRENTSV